MNSLILIVAVVIVGAMAAPEGTIRYIPVLERTETRDPSGNFNLHYVTADGTTVNEIGVLRTSPDGKSTVLVKEGNYQFRTPEGQIINTSYNAGFNGFQATGDHLPRSVVA